MERRLSRSIEGIVEERDILEYGSGGSIDLSLLTIKKTDGTHENVYFLGDVFYRKEAIIGHTVKFIEEERREPGIIGCIVPFFDEERGEWSSRGVERRGLFSRKILYQELWVDGNSGYSVERDLKEARKMIDKYNSEMERKWNGKM